MGNRIEKQEAAGGPGLRPLVLVVHERPSIKACREANLNMKSGRGNENQRDGDERCHGVVLSMNGTLIR